MNHDKRPSLCTDIRAYPTDVDCEGKPLPQSKKDVDVKETDEQTAARLGISVGRLQGAREYAKQLVKQNPKIKPSMVASKVMAKYKIRLI